MRLAVVTSGYFPVLDGVTVSVHERLRRARLRGHETLLLAPLSEQTGPRPGIVGLTSRPWGGVEGDRNPTRRALAEIEASLDAFRPDVIEVDEPERLFFGLWQLPALRYARARRVPIAAFYHTNFIDYAGDQWRFLPPALLMPAKSLAWRCLTRLYDRFDATLVPSATTCRRLQARGLRNGIHGAFNGVDIAAFTPALRRASYWAEEWGLPALEGRLVLLILGRLTRDKGWQFWRQALPALASREAARVAVIVAGDGFLRPSVESLLSSAGLQAHFLGKVGREKAAGLIANADLYATASTWENASLAVLEALASGTPVVSPRAGGIPDQVTHGRNGLLFTPGDVAGFVDCIASIANDPEKAQRLRAASLNGRQALDWEAAVTVWLEALEALVHPRP